MDITTVPARSPTTTIIIGSIRLVIRFKLASVSFSYWSEILSRTSVIWPDSIPTSISWSIISGKEPAFDNAVDNEGDFYFWNAYFYVGGDNTL